MRSWSLRADEACHCYPFTPVHVRFSSNKGNRLSTILSAVTKRLVPASEKKSPILVSRRYAMDRSKPVDQGSGLKERRLD